MSTATSETSQYTRFIQCSDNISEHYGQTEQTDSPSIYPRPSIAQLDIVKILFTRTSRRRRTNVNTLNNRSTEDRLDANGSAKSIFDWSKTAKIDINQRRAFEIFTASFVLTFYYEATINNRTRNQRFLDEKKRLEFIVKKTTRQSQQLICLLHGPAGCGKTTIIDLLIEYAREYCDYLPDFVYTTNTIVVTAMSGVAATLLMGETTHSALHLNKKTDIEDLL
jgi:hypothetical protein